MSSNPASPARRIVPIVALVSMFAIWPGGPRGPRAQSEAAAPVGVTVAIERSLGRVIRVPGSVEAPRVSLVAAEVAGRADRVHAREGDVVPSGAELVSLRTHLIDQMPIAAPTGEVVTIGSVADVRPVNGPTSIQHREWERAITIQVSPPASMPVDTLTMLGFVILIGTVVNNAILIVHQSLNLMRADGLPHRDAIRESVRTRIRPIFMSVGTSVLGMMPLVLFPGAGSELVRGLGSVVVGGLLVSTVFTLLLVPVLFSLVLDARGAIVARLRGTPDDAPGTEV